MLVVFEGIDASGKETQVARLAEKLQNVKTLTFPDYSTPIGQAIKDFLFDKYKVDNETASLLYAADRRQHAIELREWLAQGKTVLCDRYSYSNIAFMAAKGVDEDWLMTLDSGLPKPDLVLFLDLPPEQAMQRKKNKDKHEKDLEYLKRVRERYILLCEADNWHKIDASKDKDEIAESVWKIVEAKT